MAKANRIINRLVNHDLYVTTDFPDPAGPCVLSAYREPAEEKPRGNGDELIATVKVSPQDIDLDPDTGEHDSVYEAALNELWAEVAKKVKG